MITRRNLIKTAGAGAAFAVLPLMARSDSEKNESKFTFCLNTSTISSRNPGVLKYIDIAARAGYDGVELWVSDVKAYLSSGKSAQSLRDYIDASGLKVENAIGFAPWLANQAGMDEMKADMQLMASVGCHRIAAPAFGLPPDKPLDLFETGQKYNELIELGKITGVKPLLEFWGASKLLWHIGQAMSIAAVANNPGVSILADVYHLFRGNSGYEALKMLRGDAIEVFHMNDFVSSIPREQQKDSDRVYPGDGNAPMKQILSDLKNMGGTKVLSLELFNETYWKQDELLVAQTGLEKMKSLVAKLE